MKKVTLTSKVDLALREQLLREGEERELTLSSYVESILSQRHSTDKSSCQTLIKVPVPVEADVQSHIEAMLSLEDRLKAVEKENTALKEALEKGKQESPLIPDIVEQPSKSAAQELERKTYIKNLEAQQLELMKRIKDLLIERDSLIKAGTQNRPNWLSDKGYNKIVESLNELKKLFKDYSHEELLLSSVVVSLKNESSFLVQYKFSDFWSRNPQFFKTIKLKTS